MRTLAVVVTLLLTAALAYYIYVPLPDAIQEPWRLMMLDTALRTAMHLVSYRRGQVSFCTTDLIYTNAQSVISVVVLVITVILVASSEDSFGTNHTP